MPSWLVSFAFWLQNFVNWYSNRGTEHETHLEEVSGSAPDPGQSAWPSALLLRGSGFCRQRTRSLETSQALYWANGQPSDRCWSFTAFHIYSVFLGVFWCGPSTFVSLEPFRPYCSYAVCTWNSQKTPAISVLLVLTWAQAFHSAFKTDNQKSSQSFSQVTRPKYSTVWCQYVI